MNTTVKQISDYIYNAPLEDIVYLHNEWLAYSGGLAYKRIFTREEFVDHITDLLNGGSGMSMHDIVDMLINDSFLVPEEKYIAYYNDDPVTVSNDNIVDFVDCYAIALYCLKNDADFGDPQIRTLLDNPSGLTHDGILSMMNDWMTAADSHKLFGVGDEIAEVMRTLTKEWNA